MKPKFDINDYPGNYVMHCSTKKDAKTFCRYLSWSGKKWCDGDSYIHKNNYDVYGDKTCYNFNGGTFADIQCYFGPNAFYPATILEFNDFDWSDFTMKNFTKKDLKNGDVVKHRDGQVQIVCVDTGTLIRPSSFNTISYLLDDLTCPGDSSYDIVAVRRPCQPSDCQFDAFTCCRGKLVYERKEVEEMTLEEVCKALGKEIKIVKK